MKNINLFSGKFLAVASIALATVFTSCSNNDEPIANAMYNVNGNASGSQMVPAVQGAGTASIQGTYNANTNTLNYTTNWNNLSGAPTSGGFFQGAVGANGPAIGTTWNLGTTPGMTGNLTGTMVLTDAQETALMNGQWYYTMGTATNVNGEVRGQITATPQ